MKLCIIVVVLWFYIYYGIISTEKGLRKKYILNVGYININSIRMSIYNALLLYIVLYDNV